MKSGFHEQILTELSSIKYKANPSSGAKLTHADGRTDRRDKAGKSFLQLCERA